MSELTSKELLPCPFCGGTPEIDRAGTSRYSTIIVCTNCGCRHESGDEGSRVGRSWNERHAHEPRALPYDELEKLMRAAFRHGQTNNFQSMGYELQALRMALGYTGQNAVDPPRTAQPPTGMYRETGGTYPRWAPVEQPSPPPPDDLPAGYLHEVHEPDKEWPMRMYSASSDNPWGHWVQKHLDRCTYKCTALYSRPTQTKIPEQP